MRNPFTFRRGSDNFHWAVLERGWGGYYPEVGQLRRCAEGYFDLIEEVDGTEDYRLTSEEWVRRMYAIPAGGEDRVPVFAGFGAIPVAVFDAAPEPFTQRVMELAIPAAEPAEPADAAVTADMGVSRSAVEKGKAFERVA